MPENKEILTWLIDFAQDKMESQKDWNPRKELISLSLEIEKEQYKHNSEKIREFTSDNKNIYSFLRDMKDIITEFEEYIIALSKDALDMISNYGMLCSDFTGGARSPFFQLEKWQKKRFDQPTKTFIKLGDGVESWYKKTEKKDKIATIEGIANAGLMSKIRDIISHFDTFYTLYNSAKASAGNIYAFAILSNIDRYIRLYARENNLMLISDTTDLLNKIIDGKDTPFVYEKIGSHLQHFMIDEFQDTSGMQWENFMPLIDDSMAHGFDNLIVGDVKLSIYRWRNSDWNLLHSKLRDYHTGERTDNILDTNWRSAKNVIDFNNSFLDRKSVV